MAEIAKWNGVAIANIDKFFGVSKSSLTSIMGLTFPATGFYDYDISQSCRFNDDDSAYMHKTPGGAQTPRKIVCFSTWLKRGNLTNVELLSAGSTAGDNVVIDIVSDRLRININTTGGQKLAYQSSDFFRDPSSWYHIFVAYNTVPASPTITMAVNGRTITAFIESTNIMAQDAEYEIGIDDKHSVGRREYDGLLYMDGYLAETALVIGTEYAATDFGQFVNGVWTPKDISGLTYGTNGFHLDFADSANLGNDVNGGTDLTEVNLTATDQVSDSPTNNWCTPLGALVRDGLGTGGTYSEGNLKIVTTTYGSDASSFAVKTGKWYCEILMITCTGNENVGVFDVDLFGDSLQYQIGHSITSDGWGYLGATGNKKSGGASVAYGNSYTDGDKIGIALDMDNGKIWWSKNGTWQISGDPAAGTNFAYDNVTGNITFSVATDKTGGGGTYYWNFGQDSTNVASGNADDNGYGDFEYDVPTGFLALCSANLSDPAWMTSPTVNTPKDAFDVVLRTGDAGTPSISSLNFSPDLLWIKNRDTTDNHHLHSNALTDTDYYIIVNTQADDAQNANSVTSFDANGYTLGTGATGWNDTGEDFVDYSWLESATYGIDIVTFEGTGSAHTESHSLGAVPSVMILKNIDGGGNDSWPVYHSSMHATAPEDNHLYFDTAAAIADLSTMWNDTAPTSSVFTVGTHDAVNASGQTIHAILFAEIEGFSKFGHFIGNANADGPFVYCGFRPKWIWVKNITDAGYNQVLADTGREPYNVSDTVFKPSGNAADATSANEQFDFLSNGFKIRSAGGAEFNVSGSRMVYMAFAEFPFKYSNAA